MTIQSFAVMWH